MFRHAYSSRLREHTALVEDAVTEQMGPVAAAIVRVVGSSGSATLKEVADALRSQTLAENGVAVERAVATADDSTIKRAAALLLQHRVLRYNDAEKAYEPRVGFALARCLLPVIERHFRALYGDAGEAVLAVMAEYSVIPLDVLQSLVTTRKPTLHAALAGTVAQLRARRYLVPVDADDAVDDSARPEKRQRREAPADGGGLTAASPHVLHYGAVLTQLRHDALVDFVSRRSTDDTPAKILRALTRNDTGIAPTTPDAPNGYPRLLEASTPIGANSLLRRCEGVHEDAFTAALARLCGPELGCVVERTNAPEATYRLSYANAALALQMNECERVVFSRHGILGMRIFKTLLEKAALEDRSVAEDCICTLQQARECLGAMMRDGFVHLQEIPKADIAERNPKNSIFLWMLAKESLTWGVRGQLIRSLRNLTARLREEEARAATAATAEPAQPPQQQGGAPLVLTLKKAEFVCTALRSAIQELQASIVVMEFF